MNHQSKTMYNSFVLLTFIILQFSVHQVISDVKFEIFRSANIQLNKESHEQSDFSAFYLNGLNVKADLDEDELKEKKEEEDQETHPIDFTKINLNNLNSFSPLRNAISKKDVMINDELNDGKLKSRRYPVKLRKQAMSTTKKELNPNESGKSQMQVLDYEYYCTLNHYLGECLRKKLSSKFLIRYKTIDYKSNINQVIDELNELKSSLESSVKPTTATKPNVSNLKTILSALDQTFYSPKILDQVLSDCVRSYEKNCAKKL